MHRISHVSVYWVLYYECSLVSTIKTHSRYFVKMPLAILTVFLLLGSWSMSSHLSLLSNLYVLTAIFPFCKINKWLYYNVPIVGISSYHCLLGLVLFVAIIQPTLILAREAILLMSFSLLFQLFSLWGNLHKNGVALAYENMCVSLYQQFWYSAAIPELPWPGWLNQ